MIVGVPRESFPGENRAAMTPAAAAPLLKRKIDIRVEAGVGINAGFPDSGFQEKSVPVVADRRELFAAAEVVLQVRTYGANPEAGRSDLELLRPGQVLIGHADPLTAKQPLLELAERGITLLAMELVPRITRAQAMDALSSQANLAGYKAVLLAAERMGKIFPMLMTAAGTIQPAKVLVLGAAVAGLQAIGTARRLGAVVYAWDVRSAANEQITSVGGKVLDLTIAAAGEGQGGYAKAQSADQEKQQQEALVAAIAKHKFDAVITTAAIPGRPSPKLLTEDAVKALPPGAVIVDLGAERGGNCVLTVPGQVVVRHGVTIVGTLNLPSLVAHHATQMYAGNLVKLLELVTTKDGTLQLDPKDEVIAGMLVCQDGKIVHSRVREQLGLGPLTPPTPPAEPPGPTSSEPSVASPAVPAAAPEPKAADSSPAVSAASSDAPAVSSAPAVPTAPSEPAPAAARFPTGQPTAEPTTATAGAARS